MLTVPLSLQPLALRQSPSAFSTLLTVLCQSTELHPLVKKYVD